MTDGYTRAVPPQPQPRQCGVPHNRRQTHHPASDSSLADEGPLMSRPTAIDRPSTPAPFRPKHALPPLSLPLPAPQLTRRASDHLDPFIQTPTSPNIPAPPRRTKSGPEFPLPSRSPATTQAAVRRNDDPSSASGADGEPRTLPTPSAIKSQIQDLAAVIERVYVSYSRQDELLQSPIIVDSLHEFRDRADDLVKLLPAPTPGHPAPGSRIRRRPSVSSRGDRTVTARIQVLEEDWWSSAVVANWFGPQPHTVKRQKSKKKRQSRIARTPQPSGHCALSLGVPGATGVDVGEKEAGMKKGSSLMGIDELGEMTIQAEGPFREYMSAREVELRRISTFVGVWDE